VIPIFDCFTTNYDMAFETFCNNLGISYDRGMSQKGAGSVIDPRRLHQEGLVWRVIKLHGSVDLLKMKDGSVRQTSLWGPNLKTLDGKQIEGELLIYPMREKELFGFPYQDPFWEFTKSLRDARFWFFAGFSFRDDPILRVIADQATPDKRLFVISPSATKLCADLLGPVRCPKIPSTGPL